MTKICIVNGHPDPDPAHFCAALAQTYADAAQKAGHEVTVITVGSRDLPFVLNEADWNGTAPDCAVTDGQALRAADHLVFIYPLWMGGLPGRFKSWLEQVMRPAIMGKSTDDLMVQPLAGRSARVIVTMGMPALAYRLWFGAHSLKGFDQSLLRFSGVKPVRWSLIGQVAKGDAHRRNWLKRVQKLGARAL